ncbi:MAG: hypothetical protein A2178_01165 [Planctomycetes bacterium GWC2_49_10]|nr:MAG: hypothetical protein A2178_01165 [Planctomycetes bacterium GWC2_49_10]
MLKAVIFDFDGVIADTEPLHYRSTSEVLERYDLSITKEDFYGNYLGYSDHDFFEIYKNKYPKQLAAMEVETLMEQKSKAHLELIKGLDCVIKGIPQFIQTLLTNNLPVAICSGGRRLEIEQILLTGHLLKFFDIIVSADEVEVGKPDPQGFLLTLQLLTLNHPGRSIEADECVVIEDSRWGIEAAKKAGMRTVAITTSYSADELSMAHMVVDSVSELSIEDLQKLCKKS